MAKTATTKTAKAPKARPEEFAIIMTGGKQYIVSAGDTILVERLPGELKDGDTVVFDQVLLVDNGKDATIGMPFIKGAKVSATFKGEEKGDKISIIRYKAKSNRDRKVGHRQKYSEVHIDSIA
jgi:large subunit ribosomal protein L21